MKKTLLGLLIIGSLCIVGCSNEENIEEEMVTESSSSYDIDAEFEKAQNAIEEEAKQPKFLNINIQEVIQFAADEYNDEFDFKNKFIQENGIAVETFQHSDKDIKLLFYFDENQELPFAAMVSTSQFASREQLFAEKIQNKLIEYISDEESQYVALTDFSMEDGREMNGVKILDSYETFSTYQDLSPNDILSDEDNKNKIKELLNQMKFKELVSYLGSYTKENNSKESDFAFVILDYIKSNDLVSIAEELYTEKDNIEHNDKTYYKQKTEISESINLVSYIEKTEYLTIKSGFVKSDWLFADKVILSINNEQTLTLSDDNVARDILQGSTIKEVLTDKVLSDSYLVPLSEAKQITLRFKGDHDDLDIKIDANQITAIKNLAKIALAQEKINTMIEMYENF